MKTRWVFESHKIYPCNRLSSKIDEDTSNFVICILHPHQQAQHDIQELILLITRSLISHNYKGWFFRVHSKGKCWSKDETLKKMIPLTKSKFLNIGILKRENISYLYPTWARLFLKLSQIESNYFLPFSLTDFESLLN